MFIYAFLPMITTIISSRNLKKGENIKSTKRIENKKQQKLQPNYKVKPNSVQNMKNANTMAQKTKKEFKAVSPVIASLKIPDIQPVLDIITTGYLSITNQISSLINTSLVKIQTIINDFTTSIGAKIIHVIVGGNLEIKQSIEQTFNGAMQNFNTEVKKITDLEASQTGSNMSAADANLILQINTRLNTAAGGLQDAIYSGTQEAINKLAEALEEANKKVYDDIIVLVADADSSTAILPQLVYADASVISKLITTNSGAIFENIKSLLNNAMLDINGYVNITSEDAIKNETEIVNNSNNEIIKAINIIINDTLSVIHDRIDEITAFELLQTNNIIETDSSELSTEVVNTIKAISTDADEVIENVTSIQTTQLFELITKNNANIISQVDKILSTTA